MKRAAASGAAAMLWVLLAVPQALAGPLFPAPDGADAATIPVLLLEVHVNGLASRSLAELRLADGCDQIEAGVLRAAGLYDGAEDAVCLQDVAGIEYDLDREGARIEIFSDRTAPSAGARDRQRPGYARQRAGVIGQYGLSLQRVDDTTDARHSGFGDLSLTLHTTWGRVQNDQVAAWEGAGLRGQRLATSYEQDFPDNMARLTLGDSFTRAPRWGRLSAFAGVQFGTDFSMDPEQQFRPYRTFQTLLRQQSEIDVRVNGTTRHRTSAAPGFSDVQVIPDSGLNDVEIAIRDATGLTRIEDVSFFASPDGLAKAVTDYAVSLGVPRRFTGLQAEYGDTLIASGLIRRGVSDTLTAEAHGEVAGDVWTIGGGAQMSAGQLGLLNLSAGLSEADDGVRGHLVSAGLDRTTRRSSLQAQARVAAPGFRDAGVSSGAEFPDVSLRASAGLFTRAGSFRTSYSQQSDGVLADRRFVSFGWEKGLRGNRATVSASGFRDLEGREIGCTISLRMSFGAYAVRTGLDRIAGSRSAALDVARIRQADERLQWSLQSASGEAGEAVRASLQASLGAAEFAAQAGRFAGTRDVSAGVRGGFTALTSRVVLARQTTPATVVVHVPGLAGVAIYQDNRPVAVTGPSGDAVIAGVRPFEMNRLSLQPEDVPLDHTVGNFDLEFVPRRGISDVTFDVSQRAALAFTAVLPGGAPLAQGSLVEVSGSGARCPVGLDGRVYCASADAADLVVAVTPQGRFAAPVSTLRRTGRWQIGPETELRLAGIGE